MKVESNGDVRLIVAGPVQMPVSDDFYSVFEFVKKLDHDQLNAIMRDAGLEVIDEAGVIDDRIELYTAGSLMQNYWYETVKGAVPDNVLKAHEARVARYTRHVEAAKASPRPSPADKGADAFKKSPRGEPKFKPAASTNRIAGRVYAFNAAASESLAKNLTKFQRAVYETMKLAGPSARLTFDQVLEQTKANGTEFGGSDGGKNQCTYCLKILTQFELVLVNPAQAEIPGTPEPRPSNDEMAKDIA